MTVYFEDCTNVILKGITIQNAPFWTVHLVGCLNTEAARLTIHNEKRMPNTDGFDIDRSKNTVIHDCEIITGDDAICPKCTEETARYGDCTGLIVTNCRITTQSAAVKFGSSSFGNFVNCQFSNLTIEDTNRGLAFQLRDPGSVENILFENITIKTKHYSKDWWGSGEPIFISILPRDNQTDLTGQRIRNVIFKNIQCDAENGVFIGSAADGMITNVLFDHVEIRLRKALAAATEFDLRPWKGVAKVGAKLAGINSVHSNHYSLQNFRVTDIAAIFGMHRKKASHESVNWDCASLFWGILPIWMRKITGGSFLQQLLGTSVGIVITAATLQLIFGFEISSHDFWLYYLSGACWSVGQGGQYREYGRLGVSTTMPISTAFQIIGNSLIGGWLFGEWHGISENLLGIGA